MKWTFRLRGKEVTLTAVEGVAAVRPSDQARSRATSRARLHALFGSPALDTARGGRFGLDLPSRNRQLFERAGWLFVEAAPAVARAAPMTRTTVADAEAVQRVFVDRSVNMQVTTDVITVQVDPEVSASETQQRLRTDRLRVVRPLPFAPNTFEVSAAVEQPLPELVLELQQKPYYRFAEPMLLQTITGRLTPTDPQFGLQWQHKNDGSNGGTPGADIHSEEAWNVTRGRDANGRPVRLAVIDNGMQVRHPDLRRGIVGGGHFRSNGLGSAVFARYRPGTGGFPDNAHGTFCLGMAGALMNNGRGG